MRSPSTPLELLHPEGRAEAVLLLGSGCPPELAPHRPATEGPADLVILAPNEREAAAPEWEHRVASVVREALRPDGLVCVMGRFRTRRRLLARLREQGLREDAPLLILPHWRCPRWLVPARREALRFAMDDLLPRKRASLSRTGARLARALAGLSAPRLFPQGIPVVRSPGGRSLFAWLDVPSDPPGRSTGVLRVRARGEGVAVTLLRIGEAERVPSWVLKTRTGAGAELAFREAEALLRFGEGAERAGARVPRVRRPQAWEGYHVETFVQGRPAAQVLAGAPRRLGPLLGALAVWLERWGLGTRRTVALDGAWLERHVTAPAHALLEGTGEEGEYLAWLRDASAALRGHSVPLVAVHQDLTMENVVLHSGAPPGIVDWGSAEEEGPPLHDFFYAAGDAVAQADRCELADAVLACFSPEGRHRPLAGGLEERIREALEVPEDFALLCFHACWLGHAARERARGGSQRRFQDVVALLARGGLRRARPAGRC